MQNIYQEQRTSRQIRELPSHTLQRLEASQRRFSESRGQTGYFFDGSVCLQDECPVTHVLQLETKCQNANYCRKWKLATWLCTYLSITANVKFQFVNNIIDSKFWVCLQFINFLKHIFKPNKQVIIFLWCFYCCY